MKTDNLLHILASLGVSALIATLVANIGANTLGACLSGFLGGMACGFGKEYGDSKSQGNKWSWKDIGYDAIGSAIGCLSGFVALLI